ncbi:MAG: hypothetical protein CK429_14615 [Mycobacterium sp.]|nr:MAG: hypothetical protein CK429_14615 [Mycobacterium sp.]
MRDSLNAVGQREYYMLEFQWKTRIQQGREVSVDVSISYPDGSLRPSSYDVTTYVDGAYDRVQYFYN